MESDYLIKSSEGMACKAEKKMVILLITTSS